MRVAALYDIHGNLPALEAVLADVDRQGVDRIVVGGDVIPGPQPRETIAALLELDLPTHFIAGNGEREVLAMRSGGSSDGVPEPFRDLMRWVGEQLDPEMAEILSVWPETTQLAIPGVGDVLFCHATPRNDFEIFTRLTPEADARSAFEGTDAGLVVCGHTHMQFERSIGGTRVVNAGSVGMPFGEPGAYWLLVGPDVELRRVDYDLEAAAERIHATEYPGAEEFGISYVLGPPSEAAMLERFEESAARVGTEDRLDTAP